MAAPASPIPIHSASSMRPPHPQTGSSHLSEHPHHAEPSPIDRLRQMNLADANATPLSTVADDVHAGVEALALSGNVISATFCLPHQIDLRDKTHEWVTSPRRGTSALFDSLSYLSSSHPKWRHTLVGWTGEIELADEVGQQNTSGTAPFVPLPSLDLPNSRHCHTQAAASAELTVSTAERRKLETQLGLLQGGEVAPVWLADEVHADGSMTLRDQRKWRKYGEHELFTLFHYKQNPPSDGKEAKKAWSDYVRLNEAFAARILEVYRPGDIITIHDYHLLLLPELIRQSIPNAYVSVFLHIPFPSSEYYRCLPKRKLILNGILSAHMVAFQSQDYARHFSASCQKVTSYDATSSGVDTPGGHVPLEVCPIGIDAAATLKTAFHDAEVALALDKLKKTYAGQKIIIGRDRLDSIRGVAQKLQAFEVFLQTCPAWRSKVTLIQVTSPTSIEDRDGKGEKTGTKIAELVGKINATFGNLSYQPVQYVSRYIPKEEYYALLQMADLGLITSVRDGMNTTALEYVVCQQKKHAPLIISEFSGTADCLSAAIKINPWDIKGVANAINQALNMSAAEREAVHHELFRHVTDNDVQAWTDNYIEHLMAHLQLAGRINNTPRLDCDGLIASYQCSEHRLFMLDYDGTLTNIVHDPNDAIPSDRVIRTLQALASDNRNSVWIVSGRPQSFLQEWMGHIKGLGLSAEHGCFMRKPGETEWLDITAEMDLAWQDKVVEIFNKYDYGDGSSTHIERKKIALTWHYRRADPKWAAIAAKDCLEELREKIVPHYEVEVMKGKKNLEVRPRAVNKGEIAKRLVAGFKGLPQPDFVVSMGDDHTDEDMFRALRQAKLPADKVFAVTVGPATKQTLATYHVPEPADVIGALTAINDSGANGAQHDTSNQPAIGDQVAPTSPAGSHAT